MRYFVPSPRLSIELPPQSLPEDKLGGLPWGLQPSNWPICRDCGKSQSLLAQFVHEPVRLNLGRAERVLSVFQCNHDPGMCSNWEGDSGANACFVTEPEDLVAGLTRLPSDLPPIEREARIVAWLEQDDAITEAQAAHFYSWAELSALPDAEVAKVTGQSRLGGVPAWVQSPDEAPSRRDGWRFIGQLDSNYSFLTAPAVGFPGLTEDPKHWEGQPHYCSGSNFGAGRAYMFLRDTPTTPEGWFFWQC